MDKLEQLSGSEKYYLECIILNRKGETLFVRGTKDLRKILASKSRVVSITSEDSHESYVGKTLSGNIESVIYVNPNLPKNQNSICLNLDEFERRGTPEVIRRNIQLIPTDEKSRYVA